MDDSSPAQNIGAVQPIEPCQRQSERLSVSWFNPYTWFAFWTRSTMTALEVVERRLLSSIWQMIENKYVPIRNGTQHIRTIVLNKSSSRIPLVMLHGMGSGVGLWILNLETLSRSRPLYALDLLGFGRSSRPKFSEDAMMAEMEFVESLEEWRCAMDLDKFILLGHSLGGFIAAAYAIRYPQHIRHLILVDPWGFPKRPEDSEHKSRLPLWVKAIAKVMQPFNPLAALRAAGPWGPGLVAWARPDLTRKFSHLFGDKTVSEYVYHCNAQTPSGEVAFSHLTIPFGWAKFPMIGRVTELLQATPMTVIYGSRSWVDSGIGYEIKYKRPDSYVNVQVVRGAGHHVYADRAFQFNTMVNHVGNLVELQMDLPASMQTKLTSTPKRQHRISEGSPDDLALPSDSGTRPSFKSSRKRIQSESTPTAMSSLRDRTTARTLMANQTLEESPIRETSEDRSGETSPDDATGDSAAHQEVESDHGHKTKDEKAGSGET